VRSRVHRGHGELEAGAAAQEEHVIPFGHLKQLLDQSLGLVHDGHELLGAV